MAQQDQCRREQDQRGRGGQQHHRDARVGEGPQEVLGEEQHRREGHRDREGREEDGAAGRAQGRADRRQGFAAGGEFLTEAADDEQGVVDGQSQAEGRGEVHREDRHVGELGQAAQHRVGAEDGDDADAQRQQGGHRAAEDHHQQHQRDRQGDHLGTEQVLLDDRLHLVPYGDRAADSDLHRAVGAPESGRDPVQGLPRLLLVAGDAGGDQRLMAVLCAQGGRLGLPVGADPGDALLTRQALRQPLGLGGDRGIVQGGATRVHEEQEVGLGGGELALQRLGRVRRPGVRILPAAAAQAVGDTAAGQHGERGEHQGHEQRQAGAGRDEAGPASDPGWPVDFGHCAVSPSP